MEEGSRAMQANAPSSKITGHPESPVARSRSVNVILNTLACPWGERFVFSDAGQGRMETMRRASSTFEKRPEVVPASRSKNIGSCPREQHRLGNTRGRRGRQDVRRRQGCRAPENIDSRTPAGVALENIDSKTPARVALWLPSRLRRGIRNPLPHLQAEIRIDRSHEQTIGSD
jgi:hypothetical protein